MCFIHVNLTVILQQFIQRFKEKVIDKCFSSHIWHVALSREPLQSLIKYVAKTGPALGDLSFIWTLTRNLRKNIFSIATSPKAKTFGIQHCLSNLYKNCSNYTPGVKIGPFLRSHVFSRAMYTFKISSSHNPYRLHFLYFARTIVQQTSAKIVCMCS